MDSHLFVPLFASAEYTHAMWCCEENRSFEVSEVRCGRRDW